MSWLSKSLRRLKRAVHTLYHGGGGTAPRPPSTPAATAPAPAVYVPPQPTIPAAPTPPPTVDPSVVTKYMRGSEVYLHGLSLCPDKVCKFFLDDEEISALCQVPNQIYTTAASADQYTQGEGLINTTSNAFCKVIATSNNIIYTDENYLNVRVSKNNTIPIPSFIVGDLVYQTKMATSYTQVQNDKPLYTTTYPGAWSTWMNNHAVWESQQSASNCQRLFPNVTFPVTGTYKFLYEIDDYGSIYLDNNLVAFTNGSFAVADPYSGTNTVSNVSVAAGDHAISWNAVNTGGPGGISLVISYTVNGNEVVIFDSRTAYTTQLTKVYHIEPTFQGRVENFQLFESGTIGVLAIKPEFGIFSTSSTASESMIKKMGGTPTDVCLFHSILNGDSFAVGSVVKSARSPLNTALITNYRHHSGIWQGGSTGTTFYTGSKYTLRAGDFLTISGGSGLRQSQQVSSVSGAGGNQVLLASGVTGLTANSRYSIGLNVVDDYGSMGAVFNIPEDEENKLKGGERQVIIVDSSMQTSSNNQYLMRASAGYKVAIHEPPATPALQINPQQFAVPVPPPVSVGAAPVAQSPRRKKSWLKRAFDPVAQTFMVPGPSEVEDGETKGVYGMFVSSIDLWFSAKPYNDTCMLPVMCRIVNVETGLPTNDVIAETHVEHRNVLVPATNTFDPELYTKFKFKDPVFLAPGKEYAIVVLSESPDYYVLIAELGGYILGSNPPRRVSQQPNLGSFFKSQNASTWTPIQTQDMVFRINKCVFNQDSIGTAVFSPRNQEMDLFADSIAIHTTESNYKPTNTKYWFKSRNILGDADDSDIFVPINTHYDFGDDLKTSLKTSTRRRWIPSGDTAALNVGIQLVTTDASVSPVLNKEKLTMSTYTSIIDEAGISNTDITVVNGGQHYAAANIEIHISEPNDPEGVVANAYVQSLKTMEGQATGNVDSIIVDGHGAGYFTTPQIRFVEKFEVGTITSNSSSTMTDSSKTWTSEQQTSWAGKKVEIISSIISAGSFVVGKDYIIDTVGSTDFTQIGAESNCVGVKFTASGTGNSGTSGKAKLYTTKTIASATATVLTISGGWDAGMPNNLAGLTYKIINPNNASGVISGETSASGGNCEVRYITKRVDLADGFDAGDLRIYLDCIRPRGTNICVYYKVKSAADNDTFESKTWQLMNKVDDKYSVDQHQLIELEFRPKLDGNNHLIYYVNGAAYPKGGLFKQFAIKIVMSAGDPTVTPVVTNFSAIATPAG